MIFIYLLFHLEINRFIFKQIIISLNRMSKQPSQLIVCKNFKLVRKLGTGAFGQIYLAEDKSNPSERYAAKLEEAISKFPQLHHQAKIYKYLSSFGTVIGIPKIYTFTTQGKYNVMLMDLLGPSLQDLFGDNGKKLSLKTVLQIAEQMVQRIQVVHEKNILHRDIKPDNFLMGSGKNSHILYLVDFGLSKKYIQQSKIDKHIDKHIPYKQGKELTGTARYASINTHMGLQQSRRDDIQSIGYVLMYLLRGVLPWQNMKAKDTKSKYKMIMQKKIATSADFLSKGFPNQLATFINYAKSLKFEQKPDYKYLKNLMVQARKANKIQMDYVYDWGGKTTTQTTVQTERQKTQKVVYQKVEHIKNKKEQAINEALKKFNMQGVVRGSLLKSGQISQGGLRKDKQIKQVAKSANKPVTALGNKNQNNILFSGEFQSLIATKILMPKISVIHK